MQFLGLLFPYPCSQIHADVSLSAQLSQRRSLGSVLLAQLFCFGVTATQTTRETVVCGGKTALGLHTCWKLNPPLLGKFLHLSNLLGNWIRERLAYIPAKERVVPDTCIIWEDRGFSTASCKWRRDKTQPCVIVHTWLRWLSLLQGSAKLTWCFLYPTAHWFREICLLLMGYSLVEEIPWLWPRDKLMTPLHKYFLSTCNVLPSLPQ